MNKNIKQITITYDDGTIESFPKSLIDSLVRCQDDHISIIGFIKELVRQCDIKYALASLTKQHDKEMETLEQELNNSNEIIIEQKIKVLEKKYKDNLNRQRGSVSGTFIEKFIPYFPEYSYNQFDLVHVGKPFDILVLNGLEENKKIDSLIFQEIKTGANARAIPSSNSNERVLMDFIMKLGCPQIKYEHWAKRNDDKIFSIVSHDEYYK